MVFLAARWCALAGCLVLAAAIVLVSSLSAADPLSDAKDKSAPAGERIRKIFDQKISIDIADQPLYLALNQLRELTTIEFVFDRLTIQMVAQQMGQDADSLPVNVKAKDTTVKEVLAKIIKPYNLGYAIIGDAVFVSTDDMAMQRQLRQHITVDFEKVELAAALDQLKKETATNIKLDEKAAKEGKTAVSLQIDDVSLETAVRLLAEIGGLKAVRIGNVLFVTPRANAAELRKTGAVLPFADDSAMNPRLMDGLK